MKQDTHAVFIKDNGSSHYRLFADGKGFSEALKISNKKNVSFVQCRAINGEEDCLDIVRGDKITFTNCVFEPSEDKPRTRTIATIKGGATNVEFIDCLFRTENKTRFPWQISVGDYTIYDREKTTPKTTVKIRNAFTGGLRTVDTNGPKPRVLVLNGVVDADDSVKVWKVPSILVKLLFAFQRRFGDRRKPTA
jgi:hypothetical protein